jgi:hypothetical protein
LLAGFLTISWQLAKCSVNPRRFPKSWKLFLYSAFEKKLGEFMLFFSTNGLWMKHFNKLVKLGVQISLHEVGAFL